MMETCGRWRFTGGTKCRMRKLAGERRRGRGACGNGGGAGQEIPAAPAGGGGAFVGYFSPLRALSSNWRTGHGNTAAALSTAQRSTVANQARKRSMASRPAGVSR